ncbi:hypothetical protein HPG69_001577, partial [Diceros bicornis minor]
PHLAAHFAVALKTQRWHLLADPSIPYFEPGKPPRNLHTLEKGEAWRRLGSRRRSDETLLDWGQGSPVSRVCSPRAPLSPAPANLPYPEGRWFPGLGGRRRGSRCTSGTGGWCRKQCPREPRGGGLRRPFGSNAASPTGRIRGRGWRLPALGALRPSEGGGASGPRLATHSRPSRTRLRSRVECETGDPPAEAATGPRPGSPWQPSGGADACRGPFPRDLAGAASRSRSCSSSCAPGHLWQPLLEVESSLPVGPRRPEGLRLPQNRKWLCGLLKSKNFVSLTTPSLASLAWARETLKQMSVELLKKRKDEPCFLEQ